MSRKEISYIVGAMIATIGFQMVDELLALPYIGWNLYAIVVALASGVIVGKITGTAIFYERVSRDNMKLDFAEFIETYTGPYHITEPRGTITWN
jgi:hypothetical protein